MKIKIKKIFKTILISGLIKLVMLFINWPSAKERGIKNIGNKTWEEATMPGDEPVIGLELSWNNNKKLYRFILQISGLS